ncbi:MAG TPA: hypothetical protein VD931_14835, partial [Baekduia sp.]|nr:hypothetical protein [Baekduia sp.]
MTATATSAPATKRPTFGTSSACAASTLPVVDRAGRAEQRGVLHRVDDPGRGQQRRCGPHPRRQIGREAADGDRRQDRVQGDEDVVGDKERAGVVGALHQLVGADRLHRGLEGDQQHE